LPNAKHQARTFIGPSFHILDRVIATRLALAEKLDAGKMTIAEAELAGAQSSIERQKEKA
jgi:hypothetical protein